MRCVINGCLMIVVLICVRSGTSHACCLPLFPRPLRKPSENNILSNSTKRNGLRRFSEE